MKYEKIFQDIGMYDKGYTNYNYSADFSTDFAKLADNYKESGDILIDSLDFKNHKADQIIIPTIYFYRHSLDLILKAITSLGMVMDEKLKGEEFFKEIKKVHGHDLDKLWKMSKPYIKKYLNEDIKNNPEGLFFMEECIKEIHSFDKKSTKLRYPAEFLQKTKILKTNKFGDKKDSYGINVVILKKNFNKYYSYFSGSFDVMFNINENSDAIRVFMP